MLVFKRNQYLNFKANMFFNVESSLNTLSNAFFVCLSDNLPIASRTAAL